MQRRKYLDLVRLRGMGMLMSYEECKPAADLCRLLHEQGMSWANIAKQAGCSRTTIERFMRPGATTGLMRGTYNAVLCVRYADPREVGGMGALTNFPGSSRRLQALAANGLSIRQIASLTGVTTKNVQSVQNGGRVYAAVALRIREAYEAAQNLTPESLGSTPYQISRAKNAAERHGWAASKYWDDDTIDDPGGIPDWTGACGTQPGYLIHMREGHRFIRTYGESTVRRQPELEGKQYAVSSCGPCAEAHSRYKAEQFSDGRSHRHDEILDLHANGVEPAEISFLTGAHIRTVNRAIGAVACT